MKKFLLVMGLAMSVNCFGGSVTAKVSFIQVNNKTGYPNIVAIKPSIVPSSRPSCATDTHGRFAASLETEAGRAIYSMVLAAQASEKTLEIYGTNTCIGGALEEIDYIRIKE
ncbi:hypothetical protein [Agaribacterium sp. ZY112]|uniref:hypothetical protein n=1 Tax=Agaribacterium sp. ZY112 TaxID=3233574 RepID=UPI0035236792